MKKPRVATGIAAVIGLAVLLRFCRLGHESLWFDEGWTWWLTSLSASEMLGAISDDVMPPLYFYLLKAWRVLAGDVGEAGLRLPSAVFASLTLIPFLVLVCRSLRTPSARLVACALMAISFMQIDYAQEARPYALVTLAAMSALACVPTLASRRSWGAIVAFACSAAIGLYAHNMMFFTGVGLACAWIAWPGERTIVRRCLDMLIACGIVAALYAPWTPTLFKQMRSIDGTFWASRPGFWAVGVSLSSVSGVDAYAMAPLTWRLIGKSFTAEAVMIVTTALVVSSLVVSLVDAARRPLVLAIACVALLPMLVVFLYSQVSQPIFMERAFIVSSATMPLLLAIGIESGVRSARRAAACIVSAIGVMAIVSTAALLVHESKEDWRGAYTELAKLPSSPRRLVVFTANEGQLPFDFYVHHDPARTSEPRTGSPAGFFGKYPPRTIPQIRNNGQLFELIGELYYGRYDEVFLVLSHEDFADPNGLTEAYIRSRGTVVAEHSLRKIRVIHVTLQRS